MGTILDKTTTTPALSTTSLECQPLDDSTCPGDDNYCEISGKCVSYQHYDERACHGGTIDGDYVQETLEQAITSCNEDSQCGCLHHNSYYYYLYKGTELQGYSDWEAWVKT